MHVRRLERIPFGLTLLAAALLLSVATVAIQVDSLGMHFIRVKQEQAHQEMLAGNSDSPWQYRILADLVIEPVIRLFRKVQLPTPAANTFIAVRFLQAVFVLCMAGLFYRRLGLPLAANLLGLSVLTWGMGLSHYNSDLSFSIFFDVAFYLLAGLLIVERRYMWIPLLMVPAALNRETSLLIPVMLAAYAYTQIRPAVNPRPAYRAAAASIAIFAAIFIGLRLYYGPRPYLTADRYYPGPALMLVNLSRWATWQQLLVTLGILPILAALSYAHWPPPRRVFAWSVVPIWIVVHFAAALVAETQLMLVPHALIFIPGALFGLMAGTQAIAEPGAS